MMNMEAYLRWLMSDVCLWDVFCLGLVGWLVIWVLISVHVCKDAEDRGMKGKFWLVLLLFPLFAGLVLMALDILFLGNIMDGVDVLSPLALIWSFFCCLIGLCIYLLVRKTK